MPGLALHSFSKAIEIPATLRDQPLEARETSARLSAVLNRFGVRVLGDLQGRKVIDFAWEKNCGPKTLYELDLLARRVRFENGKASCNVHRCSCGDASHNFGLAANGKPTEAKQADVASFAIPESVCHLAFSELPITRRLANVLRSIGARTLGDLNGRNVFDLLEYKACGWRTISEIQQLIERAVSGEFDIGQIEENTAATELLSLLEQGLAKLPVRDRQFLLARIGGETGSARSARANRLCLSYAEIGRRCGLTRARVHKVSVNTLHNLRKIWGPRVPRLLEVIRGRCLSMICPLTPQLLAKWVDWSPATPSGGHGTGGHVTSFRLSMEAHVRLIALLDKSVPCWLDTNDKRRRSDDSVHFDLALAHVARQADGYITVAEAYRKLPHPTGRDYCRPTVENFLRMLRGIERTLIEFNDPQIPIVRLRPRNAEEFSGRNPKQHGKASTARKIHPNLPTIPKNLSCQSLQFCNDYASLQAIPRN